MSETSWVAWEGWAFVGTVAQILSLLTLVVGAWRFTRQRRQFPLVFIDFAVIGKRTFGPGVVYHVVEFRNLGRSTAIIQGIDFREARVDLTDDYRPPRALPSGQSFQLLLTWPSVEAVWSRTALQAPDDRDRFVLQWFPLLGGGPLGQQYAEDHRAWVRRSWVKRFRDFLRGVPVEPGGAPLAVLRRGKRTQARERAVSTSEEGLWSSAIPGSSSIIDLPVVG